MTLMGDDTCCSCKPEASAALAEGLARSGTGEAVAGRPLCRSVFRVPGMDCPSEEQMIRLRLSDAPVEAMSFDLPGRTLTIDHAGDAHDILKCLLPLGYGAELQDSEPLQDGVEVLASERVEAKVLWLLLGINAAMFVVELVAGWLSNSAGLIADAADMFADAAVYGLALFAVGKTAGHKLRAAHVAGSLQLILALGALSETGRRAIAGHFPDELTMIGIALLALAANVACLLLISRHRHRGAHMQASYIFSANDVLANLGVIVAGGLVLWTGSPWPDWVVGFGIGIVVLLGSIRILRLS